MYASWHSYSLNFRSETKVWILRRIKERNDSYVSLIQQSGKKGQDRMRCVLREGPQMCSF